MPTELDEETREGVLHGGAFDVYRLCEAMARIDVGIAFKGCSDGRRDSVLIEDELQRPAA